MTSPKEVDEHERRNAARSSRIAGEMGIHRFPARRRLFSRDRASRAFVRSHAIPAAPAARGVPPDAHVHARPSRPAPLAEPQRRPVCHRSGAQMNAPSDYGLWSLVVINSLVFI